MSNGGYQYIDDHGGDIQTLPIPPVTVASTCFEPLIVDEPKTSIFYCPCCGESTDFGFLILRVQPGVFGRFRCPHCETAFQVEIRYMELQDEKP